MNEPWISVEIEDHWLIRGEERIKVAVRKPMRMILHRLQFEQIHHVDSRES